MYDFCLVNVCYTSMHFLFLIGLFYFSILFYGIIIQLLLLILLLNFKKKWVIYLFLKSNKKKKNAKVSHNLFYNDLFKLLDDKKKKTIQSANFEILEYFEWNIKYSISALKCMFKWVTRRTKVFDRFRFWFLNPSNLV